MVPTHPGVPTMTEGELVAWAVGYLTGYERAADELGEPPPDLTEQVKAAGRASEQAGRRKVYREAWLRGQNPTPDSVERALWTLHRTEP